MANKKIPTPGELASVLKLPGGSVSMVWQPSLATPRIRNAAKKMLTLKACSGYGEAANIAKHLAEHVGMPLNSNGKHVYTIPALSKELQPRAEALVTAHFTAYLLQGKNALKNSWSGPYVERARTDALASIALGHRTTVGLYYTPMPTATRELWDKTFLEIAPPTAEDIQRQQTAIDLLDSPTPITLTF